MNQQLSEYIRQQRAAGLSDETIKQNLLTGGGWTVADVEAALSSSQQSPIYTDNKKAKIGLVFGVLAFVGWWGIPIFGTSVVYLALVLAIIGIVFAIWGFKPHKTKATIAIVLCLINIAPSLILTQFMYQIGYIGNEVYSESDFSIEIPHGWVKIKPQVEARSLRVMFAPKSDSDTYQPRMFITSAQENGDLATFGKTRESKIKADTKNTVLSSKIAELDGKQAYVIRYTYDNQGNKIMNTEYLVVKNGLGYIVSAAAQDATYTYNSSQISQSFWTLTIK